MEEDTRFWNRYCIIFHLIISVVLCLRILKKKNQIQSDTTLRLTKSKLCRLASKEMYLFSQTTGGRNDPDLQPVMWEPLTKAT